MTFDDSSFERPAPTIADRCTATREQAYDFLARVALTDTSAPALDDVVTLSEMIAEARSFFPDVRWPDVEY